MRRHQNSLEKCLFHCNEFLWRAACFLLLFFFSSRHLLPLLSRQTFLPLLVIFTLRLILSSVLSMCFFIIINIINIIAIIALGQVDSLKVPYFF